MEKKIVSVLLSAVMAVSAVMIPQNSCNITYAEEMSEVENSDHWMSEKKPYQYTDVTEYLAGQEKYFAIGGTSYDEGYVFYLWNAARTSQVLYNLKGEYDNFSFNVGHVDNTSMYTADLKIYLDGELTETIHLTPSDISKRVSIDVSGVKQLKIKMTSEEELNHYDITYGVYNGSFIKNTYVAEEIPLSNIVGNKEPYQTDGENTGVVRSKDKESFFMAGDEYTDCMKMYLWNPARSSRVYFNFGGDYESVTFLFGHIDNTTRVPATLSIELDGETVQTITREADDLPTPVTVPLEGVHQMVLSLSSDVALNNYDIYYGLGAIQLKSLGFVKGVTLDQENVTLAKENPSFKLHATIIPNDANNKNIIWSSDNEAVAKVDENGLVTAVSKGTAVITATTEEGEYKAACTVTVDMSVLGDIDENGSIDSSDALMVLKFMVKLQTPTEAQKEAADVDHNGNLDSADSLLILKYMVKLIESF